MPRGEDLLLGLVALLLAALLARRIYVAMGTGEIPLYRTRIKRSVAGEGKFRALVALNALVALGILLIAADLLFGLGLRPR
ncbi:hypothetical protein [Sphingomonas xanthus]|uniref:Uncharacterized protein n=1 Tax=Sphingomonas xanthus TaxID=2594473 RepID=A0A516ISI6_9SPHN|nr:hypothetical protein [Sphingomonas xanthus]QDP19784.1 hypothetical protein FMM02_07345 [Sphingomonas xanthus]